MQDLQISSTEKMWQGVNDRDIFSFTSYNLKMYGSEVDMSISDFLHYFEDQECVKGIYIFSVKLNSKLYPVYIGESGENVWERIQHINDIIYQPDKFYCQIDIMNMSDKSERMRIEESLIRYKNPPLNETHRTGPAKKEILNFFSDNWKD